MSLNLKNNLLNNISAVRTLDLKFNTFNHKIIYNDNYIEDYHYIDIQRKILNATNEKIGNNKKTVFDAVTIFARDKSFNPIQDWIKNLKWDGNQRLKTLFTRYLGCDDNIYYTTLPIFLLVGSIKRIMRPGTKFDTMFILAGEQGIKKSTFIKKLCPFEFAFDTMTANLNSKDSKIKLLGKIFIEFEELNNFSKSDINLVKGFLSSNEDKFRKPFDVIESINKRTCIFFGSTNDNEFLRDPTGERRFYPINCKTNNIDIKTLIENKQQLWSEAYYMYYNDTKCYPTADDIEFNKLWEQEIQNNKEIDELEGEILKVAITMPKVKIKDILSKMGFSNDKMADTTLLRRFARILKMNGYTNKRDSDGKYWIKKENEEEYLYQERESIEDDILPLPNK